MDKEFDNFAKRHGPTLGRTNTAAYRDAMDASKKQMQYLKTDVFVVRPRRAVASFRVKMIKLQQLRLICSHGIGHTLSLIRLQRECYRETHRQSKKHRHFLSLFMLCSFLLILFFSFSDRFPFALPCVLLPVFYLSSVRLQPVLHASPARLHCRQKMRYQSAPAFPERSH